ncbi:hypothetical protein SEPCBS119000_003852 [Sporothrix epigloea]|uniref:Mitochondrial outer membrane transport complex Sam37/metaxin N-terminal domain-containing protein n=1 Tax=Sporothrix epigloea TaxID=1892477 RepID=A0ABP0DNX5_9PEZI
MSFELHIWGPAFGLPSIDPECLAAVTYLSAAAPRDTWTVVATSPSAVSCTLPALRDAQTGQWVAAGFDSLVAFVRARTPPSFTDLDAGLTPVQVADATAYSAFLRAEAAPLLALSLYVSSANWIATTRPAYSRILPFPLTWIEPPAIRASHAAGAAHLGFSSLDTDRDATDDDEQTSLTAALHAFPDRIRNTVSRHSKQQQQPDNRSAKIKAQKPAAKSLSIAAAASRLSQVLTPEAKAQIRLDEAARACLSVLAQQKGDRQTFLRDSTETKVASNPISLPQLTSLDCLAYGYLALMTTPEVPRPFLRDAMYRHHRDLAVFVADVRQACLSSEPRASTVAKSNAASSPTLRRYANPLWLRTLHGMVHSVPGLSGEWLIWLWRSIHTDEGDDVSAGNNGNGDSLDALWRRDAKTNAASWQRSVAVLTTLAGTALFAGSILGYRRLPPFGARVFVYKRAMTSFVGLGAAGALLSSL